MDDDGNKLANLRLVGPRCMCLSKNHFGSVKERFGQGKIVWI